MLSKEQTLALLKQNRAHLSDVYGVQRIGVFGSFAKGQPTDESDVDLVVEFEQPIGFRFVELAEYLEGLIGRQVDILTPAGIQGIRVAPIAKDIAESIEYV
ncbi:MAG: nucleotidyltransferase [Meiothermus sp.]|mgnify:CR=1 FL=1|jgi:predicted nucleotidyltransferase|uniref:Nucleotidyltransferase n=1 Tax=Meiothermus ruber TaxID=277 RepID=A0A7C3HSH4_MEIRU|nr:nucleotidyltransferase domain-containing protein [Meiothermus sp.]GIW29212.1 MAG: nucleotidyltransferase [Meiothermus sp.]GIW38543.1 MAG: nucleotidyltransferase [Meiothermus sp.]